MTVLHSFFASARRRRSRRIVAHALVTSLAACTSDLRTAPRRPTAVMIESGDRQTGLATAPLRSPLIIRVLDTDGNPVAGVTVRWTTPNGGTFSPAASATDERGFARTSWTLGAPAGDQSAHAMVDGADDGVDFGATASTDVGPMASPVALALTTSDGSGQTVHPDYVAMPDGWQFGHQYLLMTPYPNGNAGFENPSIFTGSTPISWAAPAGVENPIAKPQGGYLSDPDVVAVPESNELWVYYREVEARNEIFVIRSKDGVSFTAPRLVASANNHDIVSPSIVRRGANDWLMWAVNSGEGCTASSTTIELRRSANGLDWSSPEKTSLVQGGGISPWHIDVQWIPSRNEFWAIYNGKTAGSCTTAALFIATSPDGVTWKTYPSPILMRGASRELADVVYRSTFAYDPATDVIDFWYSGAKFDFGQYIWRTAYQRRSRAEVFATAARKSVAALAALAPRAGLPELVNPP
jgi:hypothetical protein